MNKLTKREKILLYLLLCLVIVVGSVYLLILPASERYSALQDEVDTLEMQQKQVDLKKGQLPALLERVEDLQVKCEALYENAFDITTAPEELDLYISILVSYLGVTPDNLIIGTTEYKDPQQFAPLQEDDEAQDPKTDEEEGLPVAAMQISGSCGLENFQAMLDGFSHDPSAHLAGASYNSNTDGSTSFVISLEFYLLPVMGAPSAGTGK